MSIYIKRHIPIAILWFNFLLLTYNYFTAAIDDIQTVILRFGTIIAAILVVVATGLFAIRTAVDIVESINGKNRVPGKQLFVMVYTMALFLVIVIATLLTGYMSDTFQWIRDWVYIPAYSVSWAFAPMYLAAAIYRTWRIRSGETLVLVGTFFLVLIARAPLFGTMPSLMVPGNWVSSVIGPIGARVLTIGAAFMALAMLLNTLMGRQAGYE